MILEHHLAQQIVDRTMAIIGQNINVMNHAGTIIASGESQRIGELHDGALLAISRRDTVEVTSHSAASLHGVKPGINMLLMHDNDIIGVIGITGDPDSLRNYAALVKMTAEMIVSQSELIEQLQRDRHYREAFISDWLHGTLTQESLTEQAKKLDIDLSVPRIVMLISFDQHPLSQAKINQIISLLAPTEKNTLIANLSINQIVLLKQLPVDLLPTNSPTAYRDHLSGYAQQLIGQLSQNGLSDLSVSIGAYFSDIAKLPLSYQSAAQVLSYGLKRFPADTIYHFDDVRLPTLLSPLATMWQGQQLASPYDKLIARDPSGQLRKTLHTLFDHQGQMKACANALFIHRNTLRYRLDKIEQITQISPHQFSGLVTLYLAAQLADIQ